MDVAMLLEVAAGIDPSRVIATDVRRSLTVGELRAEALSLGAALGSTDLPSGPVALLTTNSVQVPVILFAAAVAGRPLAPLNYRADAGLMAHLLRTVRPGVIVADPRYAELVAAAAPPGTALLSTAGPMPSKRAAASPATDPDRPALYVFTSGSTAAPKAVTLRHRHLVAYVLESVAPMSEPEGAATLIAAPTYHIAALANVLTSTYAGRRMVFLASFSPAEWLRIATTERVTHAFVVPTMLFRIVSEIENGAPAPASLRTLAYGGSRTPPGTIERALAAFPPAVGFVNAYGLTETSSTVAVLGPEEHRAALASPDPTVRRRLRSVGRALPGVDVALGAEREILVRGAQVSGELASAPGAAGSDGWLRTGDLGEIDADGFLYVLGRRDDMIIRGGENISPVEVEDVLRSYPGIRDAAVVGVPDVEWGERVEAVVEAEGPVDAVALAAWARSRLPGYKCPVRIVAVESLPRNELGKILRPLVLELVGSSAAA